MGNAYIECWCSTCNRNLSLREILEDEHQGHEFSPAERAALEAVRQYLKARLSAKAC